ncbi:MAG: hypothetical protein E7321_01800 [Clostridiales bacterium]|nr:hypothetical protein [Clostridiales bacterium]
MNNVAAVQVTAPQKSNIRKLAELIYNTGRGKEIIATLDIVIAAGMAGDHQAMKQKQEGGADNDEC